MLFSDWSILPRCFTSLTQGRAIPLRMMGATPVLSAFFREKIRHFVLDFLGSGSVLNFTNLNHCLKTRPAGRHDQQIISISQAAKETVVHIETKS